MRQIHRDGNRRVDYGPASRISYSDDKLLDIRATSSFRQQIVVPNRNSKGLTHCSQIYGYIL